MYPATSNKFSTIRPPSPTTFVNFSPPSDYPSSSIASNSSHHHHNLHHHNNSMSMKHSHTKNLNNNNNNNNKNFNKNIVNDHGMMMVNSATMSGCSSNSSGGIRNELMYHDDIDSIEFCMPENLIGGNTVIGYPGDSFTTERRRRGHSRRSNHKLEVEQQVKWTRKNIAATMERFEPTPSTSSKIDYGTTTTQTIQQQQQQNPINHVYSYAYYEPGAAKCHTNIPSHKDLILPSTLQQQQQPQQQNHGPSTSVMSSPACSSSSSSSIIPIAGPSKSPPRNSIRALLAKSFRSKALLANNQQHNLHNYHNQQQEQHHFSHLPLTSEERHTYTTRYGTTENLYEEVNDQKIRKVLSDNRIVSINSPNVKEELRRVQHNHFRVLDELNLSLEALIMPPTPPDISPTQQQQQQQQIDEKISHACSMENLSSTLNSIELKDHTCINPEFDEGDLDSGFSGSGSSSGASYNESLRYYKTNINNNNGGIQTTNMTTTTLPHNLRSCRSSTASGTSTSKSSMNSDDHGISGMMTMMTGGNNSGHCNNGSPFNFIRRCSDTQKSISSGNGGSGGGVGNNMTAGSCGIIGGTKPKKHFWTIKQ